MSEFDHDLARANDSMRGILRMFASSAFVLTVGIGGWAFSAQIESAVIASGSFSVQSNPQAVQHLEGGVVGALLVKDGQEVTKGQILIRLDAARVTADLSMQERKLIDLTLERTRLQAERNGSNKLVRPTPPFELGASKPIYDATLALQQTLLDAQQATRSSQRSQLSERKAQTDSEIEGLERVRRARLEEQKQTEADLAALRTLDTKGLVRRPVLRESERQAARVRGDLGDNEAKIQAARSRYTETEHKMLEVERTRRSEVLDRLRSIESQIADASEQRATALDRMTRLDIRAPREGMIHELVTHTVGGLVAPGQTVMSIIPSSEPLVLTAKIKPEEIDRVKLGQPASVRISAFHLAHSPELEGIVATLSPDKSKDEKTGQSFFKVSVTINQGETAKLDGRKLTPGLPAEVYIRGDKRHVITYLTQPLTDQMSKAMRER
jgi:HlyD family secretion protein